MGPIVFFDGVCNLCNNSVDFIIRRDPKATFRFSSLQSVVAKSLLPQTIDDDDLKSILLLRNGKVYHKSNAVLEIVKQLNGPWPILYVFKLVPKFIRDAVYDLVSNNRYVWFGIRDTCRIPGLTEKDRFLKEPISAVSGKTFTNL